MMKEGDRQVVCIACSIFRSELAALGERGDIDFPIHYLNSMLHMRPDELRHRLEPLLDDTRRNGANVLLLYGECHPHMDETESEPGVDRVTGRNCVEILLGPDQYRTLRGEGVFFLMPEWTMRWREVFESELGLVGENARDFMKEMHTKLLYLDTGQIPVPTEHLQAASDALGLSWEVMRVGPDHLLAAIRESLERTAQNQS